MQSIQLHGIDPVIPSCHFLRKEKATLFTQPNGLIGKNPCSNANQLLLNTYLGMISKKNRDACNTKSWLALLQGFSRINPLRCVNRVAFSFRRKWHDGIIG